MEEEILLRIRRQLGVLFEHGLRRRSLMGFKIVECHKSALFLHFVIFLKYTISLWANKHLFPPGKCYNKRPFLTDTEEQRLQRVFKKIGPGGYFDVPTILRSRTCRGFFAPGHVEISFGGKDDNKSKDGITTSSSPKSPTTFEMNTSNVIVPEMNL